MEIKKLFLCGLLCATAPAMFASEQSAIPVSAGIEATFKVETKDKHIVEVPKSVIKKILTLNNIVQALPDEDDDADENVIPCRVDLATFNIILSILGELGQGRIEHDEGTIVRIKALIGTKMPFGDAQAVLNFLVNVANALNILDVTLFTEETDVQGKRQHEWTLQLVAGLLAAFLKIHKNAIQSGALDISEMKLGSSDSGVALFVMDLLQNQAPWMQQILQGHTDQVSSVAVGLNGDIISGSWDNTVRVWKCSPNGQWVCQVLQGHTNVVSSVAVGLNGDIISGSGDNTVRVWKCSPNGQWVCQVLQGHTDVVSSVAVGLNGDIISGSGDNTVRVWRCGADGQWALHQVLQAHIGWGQYLAVASNGDIVLGSNGRRAGVWRCSADGRWALHQKLYVVKGAIRFVAVGPNGDIILGSNDRRVEVWRCGADGQWTLHQELQGYAGLFSSVAVGSNGDIISSFYNDSVCVWRYGADCQLALYQELQGHTDPVNGIAVCSNGDIISGSDDESVCIWSNPLQKFRNALTFQQAVVVLFGLQNKRVPQKGSAHAVWITTPEAIRTKIELLFADPIVRLTIPKIVERSFLRRCIQSRPVQVAALIGTVITLYRLAPNQIRVWIRNNFVQFLRMIQNVLVPRTLRW